MIYAIIAAILIILICILFLPLKVEASFAEKQLLVRCFVGGIPVCRINPLQKEEQAETAAPDKKAYEFEKNSKTLGEKIKQFAELFKTAVKLLRKYVSIDSVSIKINVGTGDASTTAVSTGILWGAVYGLLGITGSIMYIKKHDVQITPVYENTVFSFDGKCIIKSRIVYIIFIAITILMKIKSRKGKEE